MPQKITITIDGPGVTPATVSLTDLVDVLATFQAAINVTSDGKTSISLTEIRGGSDMIVLDVNQNAAQAAAVVIDAVESGDDSKLKPGARNHVRKIWKKVKNRNWNFISLAIPDSTSVPANATRITKDRDPFSIPKSSGRTSVMAYVTRVGGEPQATVKFNLSDKKGFTADVKSTAIAERIPLYKYVQLQGNAEWDTRDWSLLELVVDEIGPYEHSAADPCGSLDRLADLSGNTWDDIDPTEFFNDLRCE